MGTVGLGGTFPDRLTSGYEVPDLRCGWATARSTATAASSRPVRGRVLDMDLSAPRVQLNDFKLQGWSLVEKKEQTPAKARSVEEMRAQAKEAAAQSQKLLSPEVLRSLDASLNVEVEEVLSGNGPARQRHAERAASATASSCSIRPR